jgi:hypothetical protein
MGTARLAPEVLVAPDARDEDAWARSSTREFHSWQVVQRPSHLGLVAPHAWQTYWVVVLAKRGSRALAQGGGQVVAASVHTGPGVPQCFVHRALPVHAPGPLLQSL